ncbi:hypothetical protein [Roseibium sp. MMSF_3544]|uniref:hypothetical protein n=1 Tax=unclassified Roseibium TaxID=2629323 RepID=UPI00273F1028|nr:hypothetical protein [Roseibium sp. MMSF_3544]
MIPVSLPAPSNANPRRFRLLAIAMLVLGSAHIAERATYWTGTWDTRSTFFQKRGPVDLTIGGADFRLPLGYIKSHRQRLQAQDGIKPFSSLHLSMTWPGLAVPGSQGISGVLGAGGSEILVELEHSPGRENMRARLDPFYRRLARGGETSGPGGLKILTLSPRGSSGRDLIVYDPSQRNGFIARCLRKKTGREATCHRAIVLASGLALRYRFDQDLLHDWRRIDGEIIQKVTDFRQAEQST